MRPLTLLGLLLLGCESTSRPPPTTRQPLETTTEPFVLLLRTAPLIVHARVESVTGRDGTVGTAQVPAIFSDLSLVVLGHASRGTPAQVDSALARDSSRLRLTDSQFDSALARDSSRLRLTVLGGEVGDRAQSVSGSVRLSPGDEVLAFVDPQASPHPFIGGTTGVFHVIDGAVYALDGRAVLEVTSGGFVLAQPAPPPGRLPVGQGTATGHADVREGPALRIETVLATLARLRGT